MKKEDLMQSEVCKITKMKKFSIPYRFLVELTGNIDNQHSFILTIENLLKYSPKEIQKHFEVTKFYDTDWKRNIRKSLRTAKEKLSKLGFTEKDGPFMSGIYFVTALSPKKDWIKYLMSEYNVNNITAESVYDMGKKFDLI